MEKTRILVWDLPVRLFHWLLVASFAGAFLTAESERVRDLHVALGYTFAGLLAFRLVWGVIGSRHARFRSFASGPGAVLAYVKSLLTREPEHHVGHNPAGGWAIFALIALGILISASGYATYGGAGKWSEELHEGLSNAMLALVFLHVAAVAVTSFLHRENLAAAMVTGYKTGRPTDAIKSTRWVTAVVLAAGLAVLWSAAPGLPVVAPGLTGSASAKATRHEDRAPDSHRKAVRHDG
jgi:cytochrome b